MSTSVVSVASESPSLQRQPKYYEADGALRAYANLTIWFAVIAVVVALGAVGAMVFVRIQPPTVIRVLASGEASVVAPDGTFKTTTSPAALAGIATDQAPTDFEKENYVTTFLDHYLNYDAHTIAANWSYALNMMTGNLRRMALDEFQKNDTVGTYEGEHVRSTFKVSHVEASKADPLLYTVTGVKTVNRISEEKTEVVDEIVESYSVRLTEFERSKSDPSGLLIGEMVETQIHAVTKQLMLTRNLDAEEN